MSPRAVNFQILFQNKRQNNFRTKFSNKVGITQIFTNKSRNILYIYTHTHTHDLIFNDTHCVKIAFLALCCCSFGCKKIAYKYLKAKLIYTA